jgi:hypothetical protein
MSICIDDKCMDIDIFSKREMGIVYTEGEVWCKYVQER